MTDHAAPLRGRCNCGGVAFEVDGLVDANPAACHCTECRRGSGHVWASVTAASGAVRFTRSETLRWWRGGAVAERGFCSVCGGFLFWRPVGGDSLDIAVGLFDAPTGLRLAAHIFVSERGDYYDLDGLPAFARQRPQKG